VSVVPSALVWAKAYGSASGTDDAYGVAADAAGNIVLAGDFAGSLDFGCGAMTATASGAAYVAKLGPSAQCLFSVSVTMPFSAMNAVAIDASGNVVAAGVTYNGSNMAMLVNRYDGLGNLAWSQQYGSMMADDVAQGVAVDSTGSVYVTGSIQGTLTFLTDPSKNLTSAGSNDVALLKLQATTGNPVWTKRFGDAQSQSGYKVAVDATDDVVITGSFGGSIGFGGATYTETYGSADAYLAKFKSDGTFLWSRAYGGPALDSLQSVSISASNTIVFTETTYGPTIDLGKGPLTVAGASDAAIAKIAP
jgi:hypothetical protein